MIKIRRISSIAGYVFDFTGLISYLISLVLLKDNYKDVKTIKIF